MAASAPEQWLGVEPRHLATFATVAATGSFRGAAEDLGYAQSAVSQQIAQLERALGAVLIERGRGNRELRLTEPGRTLLTHARKIVIQLRAACADVAVLAGDGALRLAVEPAAVSLVPRLSQRLTALRPDAQLSVIEVTSTNQIELILSGQVDLAIGSFAELPHTVTHRVLRKDAWVLVVPEGSPLSALRTVRSADDLLGVDLIEDASHPLPPGVRPAGLGRVIGCDRLGIALELVRAGTGCSILPAPALASHAYDVAVVDLGDLVPPRVVSVAWLRSRRLPSIVSALELEQRADKLVAVA